jgi:hypothetical protein
MDEKSAASVLYGSNTVADATPASGTSAPSKLYDSSPISATASAHGNNKPRQAVSSTHRESSAASSSAGEKLSDAEADEQTGAEKIYDDPDAGIADTLDTNVVKLAEAWSMKPEEAATMRANTADLLKHVTPDISERRELHGLFTKAALDPVSAETFNDWDTQSRELLTARYGGDGDRLLTAARALVAAEPGLADILKATGLGSHPRVVAAMLAAADRGVKPRTKRK